MGKFKFLIAFILLTLSGTSVPICLTAQEASNEAPASVDTRNELDYIQGYKVYDDWMMDSFLNEFKEVLWDEFDIFIDIARVLAGTFTLIFFASRAYEMMTGEKQWEILPLLKPFGLLMIILHWRAFVEVVAMPTQAMAQVMWDRQEAQQEEVANLRLIRYEYQKSLTQNIVEISVEAEMAADEAEKVTDGDSDSWSIGSGLIDGWNSIRSEILGLKYRLQLALQLAMTQALETICLFILRLIVYSIFALQVVYSGILIMLGPISVSASILPMFRDSFTTWLSRFISVNLYLAIALMIMFIGGIFQEFAMSAEIERYNQIVDRAGNAMPDAAAKIIWLSGNGILSFGLVIVTFLLTGVCMLTVPTISTWIINTSGVNSGVATMGRGAMVVGGKTLIMSKMFKGK